MHNDKRIFLSTNGDDDPRFLGQDELLNLENIRLGVSGLSQNLNAENIPSPELKYYYYPAGTNLTIGRAVDYSRLRLLWFNHNSNGNHGIYVYDIELDTTYTVLMDSDTADGFDFDTDYRIDRNARIIGDLLLWTDNLNEPRCINIERGIKLNQPSYVTTVDAYVRPIPYETVTLIERPPIYPLTAVKASDSGFDNNYIQNEAYQFTWRYWYKDFQLSALAAFAELIPYNFKAEDSNYIQVKASFSETIPDDVQQVDFCVRYGNTGKTFIIQSWNKDYYYDRVAISDHNNKITQLSLSFYDNIKGIALDGITANTSFHNVARLAKTLDLARNRCFLANLLKGYDSPFTSSLQVSLTTVDTGTSASYNGTWGYITLHANFIGGCQDSYMFPFAYSTTAPYDFYYFSSVRNSTIWNGGVGTVPGDVNIALATYKGDSIADFVTYLKATQYPSNFSSSCSVSSPSWKAGYDVSSYSALGNVTLSNFTTVQVNQFFKSASTYQLTVTFFDRFKRPCGVVKTDATVVVDERTFNQTVFTTGIAWTLSNLNTLVEIPEFAYYYQIYITKNQTTRFFIQAAASNSSYVLRNATGAATPYTYGNATYAYTDYAIGLKLSELTAVGLGYTFTEGDYCRIYLSPSTNYNLKVLGQDGDYVLLSPTNIGTLNASTVLIFELYTPYKPSATEPYYGVGNIYSIASPGTASRAYSVLSGTMDGDCYALQRTRPDASTYIVEAMSPNDNVWNIWQVDAGWINYIDTIGEQQKETNIDWSDTYINGTKTNGLNNFGVLNTKDIGSTSGSIQKLQLTNKMEEAGEVMLIIAESQVLSAYLQEVQLYKAAQSEGLITTDQVIGTVNPLKFSCGTMTPGSVVEWNGTVWGVDTVRGLVWQYDTNGIQPISYFKMRRFWDRYGKRYEEHSSAAIEALCGFSYIDSCVDPSSGELLIMIPQVEVNTVTSGIPVGFAPELPSYTTLPSYATSIQNRFDIYDGQPKVMVYKYELNKWAGAYLFLPDCMEYVGNKLFAWKHGWLYLCNENTASFNNFFGTNYPQRIMLAANGAMPTAVKDVMDIGVEGKVKPSYAVCYTDYPNEQITDLTVDDFTDKEGVQYARWFRDRLSPNVTGTAVDKMYKGDPIKSVVPLIQIEFTEYTSKLIINFIDIGYDISQGHLQIIPKK